MVDLCRPVASFDAVVARLLRQLLGLALAGAALAALYAAGVAAGFNAHARTAGTLTEPGLRGAVTITRDARGVPHVQAASTHDLFFAQGFTEASDRLFQMELTRRYALGTLAEVLGPRALPIDREQRYYDVRDVAQRQWRAMGPRERAALEAFSAGVNAAIVQQPLPVEFRLLLYRPRPWTPQDSLAVSLAVSIALADSWRDVLARNDVWQRQGPNAFERYFPLSDPRYDVTLHGTPPRRDGAATSPAPTHAVAWRAAPRERKPSRRAGSNAWAAGGARTLGGRALLANDPHLDLTIPGLWYLEDLQAPGFHAAGASIPGTPGILLGHNERIAWGATNADAVASSLFVAPSALPKSGWRRERFHVRFGHDVVRDYYRTADAFAAPDPYERGRLTLVRWPALFESHSAFAAFLALDRARSAAEAVRVLARYRGTAENFVVADAGGNVAYHLAGSVPHDPAWGRYVHPARALRARYPNIPFARLPAVAPSRGGLILSANNKMYGVGYPYRLSATFDPPYRAYRIAQLLHARRRYDVAYFAAMQLDAISPIDRAFARLLGARAAAVSDAPGHLRVARELRAWNGAFTPQSRAATIEHAVRTRLQTDAASLPDLFAQLRAGDAGGIGPDLGGALYWAGDITAPWGRAGAVRIEHPLAPLRFGFLNGATLPGDGDEYTIRLQEPGFSQSFRAVWEVGEWNAGGISIPSGESGEPGSGHYDDLSRAWIAGRLEPLPFGAAAVARAAVEMLVLQPRR